MIMSSLINTLLLLPLMFCGGECNHQPTEIGEGVATEIVTPGHSEPEPETSTERVAPECSDEMPSNTPGLSNGEIVMCNPNIYGNYPRTNPESQWANVTLFEDGSWRANIITVQPSFDGPSTITTTASGCSLPEWGCSPEEESR